MTHQVTTLLSLALTSMKVRAVLTPPEILPAQMTFPITYMVILDEVGVSLGRILLIHTFRHPLPLHWAQSIQVLPTWNIIIQLLLKLMDIDLMQLNKIIILIGMV